MIFLGSKIPTYPWFKRHLSSFSNLKITEPSASLSSPISVLIVPSPFELVPEEAWKTTVQRLTTNGHETGILSLFTQSKAFSLAECVDEIHNSVTRLGPQTVLVVPSLSAFIAQKYLESFSCFGLFLVNPFPPHCSTLLEDIFHRGKGEEHRKLAFDAENLRTEFGYRGRFSGLFALSKPKFLVPPEVLFGENRWEDFTTDLDAPSIDLVLEIHNDPVRLEPKSVPMGLFLSGRDKFVTPRYQEEVAHFHSIDEKLTTKVDSSSHLFYIHDKPSLRVLNESVLAFLSNL